VRTLSAASGRDHDGIIQLYTALMEDAVDIGRFAGPAVLFCFKPFSRVVLRVTADAQSTKNSQANFTAAAKIHLITPKRI